MKLLLKKGLDAGMRPKECRREEKFRPAVHTNNAQTGIWFRRQKAPDQPADWGRTNGTPLDGSALTRMAQPNTASMTASVITLPGAPSA